MKKEKNKIKPFIIKKKSIALCELYRAKKWAESVEYIIRIGGYPSNVKQGNIPYLKYVTKRAMELITPVLSKGKAKFSGTESLSL